jgi:hypothetical protein
MATDRFIVDGKWVGEHDDWCGVKALTLPSMVNERGCNSNGLARAV